MQEASLRSIAASGEPEALERAARDLRSALPDGIREALEEVEERLIWVAERAPHTLVEPAREALTSGGKRLRPLLLMLGAETGGAEREAVLEAATAVEVLHTATLIHDDIVDRAESRRGRPTTVAEHGREAAIATGDYLFAEAFHLLAGIGDARVVRSFAEASRELAVGELDQYRAVGGVVEVEAYLEYIRMKTAGLFKAACVAGGTLGGLSVVQIDALATYGQALGIAFQMSDDVMDFTGKPGTTGKGVGTDLAEGTITLPIIFALRDGDEQKIRAALDTPGPDPELLSDGIDAVLATDAVAKTEEWAAGEIEAAIEGLRLLPDSVERDILEIIACEVVGRDS